MTTNIGPWPLDSYPPIRAHATANITPFTYYDGLTFLEILSELRTWLSKTLIPGLDGIIDIVDGMIQDALENVELDLRVMRDELNDALTSIDETDAELRSYVDDVLQQVINNAIELQDDVLAGIVLDTDSDSRAVLDDTYMSEGPGRIDITKNGVAGNGEDATATVQAIIDAAPEDATIWAPPGTVMRSAGWLITKSLNVEFSNAHLIKISNEPIISAAGSWEDVRQVNVANTGSIGVNSTDGYAVNDLIKIVSDDVMWDARPNDDGLARIGEFAMVSTVPDSTTIGINPSLREFKPGTVNLAYETNVRVGRLVSPRVNIRFKTAAYEGSVRGAMFRLKDLAYPTISGTVENAPSGVFTVGSCYGADVDVKIINANGFGYGVYFAGAVHSRVRVHASRCRHTFSDGPAGNRTPLNSELGGYGRTSDNIIVDSVSFSSDQAGFDTHHGSLRNRFVNCVANGVAFDNGPGFSLRGREHELINCTSVNTHLGFRFFDEGPSRPENAEVWASCSNHIMTGCTSRGTYQGVQVTLTDYKAPSNGPTVTILNSVIESRGSFLMYVQRARVDIRGCVFRTVFPSPVSSGTPRLFQFGLVDVRGSFELDLSSWTEGTLESLVWFPDTGDSHGAVDLNIDLYISEHGANNFTNYAVWNKVEGRIDWSVNRRTDAVLLSEPGRGAPRLQSASLKTARSSAVEASSAMRAQAIGNSTTISAGRSNDPVVVVEMTAESNVTPVAVLPGVFAGQSLILKAHEGNTGTITVPNGKAANTGITTDEVLSAGDSLRLFWAVNRWRRA